MDDDLIALLNEHPEWMLVLECYAQAEQEAAAAKTGDVETEALEDEGTPSPRQNRIPRVKAVDGVDPEQLAPVHGKLIAYGLLQFNLGGRDVGILYRLSSTARKLMQPNRETPAAQPDSRAA